MLVALLIFSSPALTADWTHWELENSVAQERDWLVIRQPEEGFCYLKQSYESDPSKMELNVGRNRVPALITPFFRGIQGQLIYQVDDREPRTLAAADLDNALAISLSPDLFPEMLAGRQLTVRVIPVGEAPRTQTFSLIGFTNASRWLERDICQIEFSDEAAGDGHTVLLEVSLVRGPDSKIQIVGETDLPSGMELMLGLRRPEIDYWAQDKIVVNNGGFRSEGFSDRGRPLPAAIYEVQVTSPLPRLQPSSVRYVIGEQGQNLSGPAVVQEDGLRRLRWTVQRVAP